MSPSLGETSIRREVMESRIEELLNKDELTTQEREELIRLTCYGEAVNASPSFEGTKDETHWDTQERTK